MYCKYCGRQLAEGAVFCHSCGRKYVEKKKKEPDEKKEFIDVKAYWQNLAFFKKVCFIFTFFVAALWSALFTVSFFVG